ncbi:hypothetical protein [Rhizobium binxianense]|uniref:hypothetical protein n=1 Tax=Rhizobium binxianense TaxID=3024242 RepID=UPI00234EC8C0|nr:hypothetical protein [Rhizobium sp. BC56]MDC7742476.1 hypothetical protein [Rhizobium sp. BC56]
MKLPFEEMQFCRERNLPHPGLVVLDTPLLTYRDPLSKDGPLAADEATIANTSLKDFFFEHLASLKGLGQFVIFENVDPPKDRSSIDRIEAFTPTATPTVSLWQTNSVAVKVSALFGVAAGTADAIAVLTDVAWPPVVSG